MVNIVELKIDWKKANSLDLKQRAEYFDNLAEQIAKASENATDKKKVMAGSQVCYISAKYEGLFLTCYNEFDVSRVLAAKIEGKTLEERMDYFNTLAKKIANIPKENPVVVPYGNKSCKIEKKYASLFIAAYREFSRARRELKKLSTPTVTIDYDKVKSLSSKERADYFVGLLKEISQVPLREDAELVTVDRLTHKVNKNDKEVLIACYKEFEEAKKAFMEETKKEVQEEKQSVDKVVKEKSNKEKMDYYLELLTSMVYNPHKKNCIKKTIGSSNYMIDVKDEEAFDEAVEGYTTAKTLYTNELKQHEYEVDKEYCNKLSLEERKNYFERLLNKIVSREIFMDTVEVRRGKETYTINAVDKKTFVFCESSISGIKHMMATGVKTNTDFIIPSTNWEQFDNIEIIEDDTPTETKKEEDKKEEPKRKWLKGRKVNKPKKEKIPKKEKVQKSAISIDLMEKLYAYRINRLISKPINNGVKIMSDGMIYRVDRKYKNKMCKLVSSYAKYKKRKEEAQDLFTRENVFRGLIATAALIVAIVGSKFSKANNNLFGQVALGNNTGIEAFQDLHFTSTNGSFQTYALAAMAQNGEVSYDTLIKDIVQPGTAQVVEETQSTESVEETQTASSTETGVVAEEGQESSEVAVVESSETETIVDSNPEGETVVTVDGNDAAATEQTAEVATDKTVDGNDAEVIVGDNGEIPVEEGADGVKDSIEAEAERKRVEEEAARKAEEERKKEEEERIKNEEERRKAEEEKEGLDGQDGETLDEQDGETLDEQDGETLGEQDGETLGEQDGETLGEQDGQTLVGQDGQALDGQDGQALDGQDGQALDGQDGQALVGQDGQALGEQSGVIIDEQKSEISVEQELAIVETEEAIRERVANMDALPEENILNADLNVGKSNEEICTGYHLTTGNTVYSMDSKEAYAVLYVMAHEAKPGSYQSALEVGSTCANRLEDGRYSYATDFYSIVSASGQFSVWDANAAANYTLDDVPDYVLKAFYDCFYEGIRNVDTIEFRASANVADGRFQVVSGGNNCFRLAQHVDRADQKTDELVLTYTAE